MSCCRRLGHLSALEVAHGLVQVAVGEAVEDMHINGCSVSTIQQVVENSECRRYNKRRTCMWV